MKGLSKEATFKKLKEQFHISSRSSWSFNRQNIVVPKGSVVEIYGGARLEWIVLFAQEQAELTVAWVEDELKLFPPAVAQRGVNVHQWLIVEAGDKVFWAIEELLASQFFTTLISPDLKINLPLWRRLQRECQRAGTTLFILSEQVHHQVGSLFVLEAQWKENQVCSRWQKCRQPLQADIV